MKESVSAASAVELQHGVKIPLRDGVCLNATLYRPQGSPTPSPSIFTLTPYIGQTYHDRGMYFAARGFAFLTVDVRGRGDSQGEFHPLINEAHDGCDVVTWLAQQPYCNGKVAMWGGSYAGFNQWATARALPAQLATIVPVAAPCPGVDFPMGGNIPSTYLMRWLTLVAGRASQDQLFADHAYWRTSFKEWFESGLPFADLDRRLGRASPTFQQWLDHPRVDDYWDSLNPTQDQYARINIPVLTITGCYDGDQLGALAHYRRHLQHAAPAVQARHYLVIGPWDHAGTRTPRSEFCGLKVGPASLVDLGQLHCEWYAWTLQGAQRPPFLRKRVAYYVMGADQWRYADSLEAVTAREVAFSLQSTVNPNDPFASGSLVSGASGCGGPDHYVHDPRDVTLAALESQVDPEDCTDQRLMHAMSGRQLFYHTAPFDTDTELSGFFRLLLWLSIDQRDADFCATVYELAADGTVTRLTRDVVRARYRLSLRQEQLIETTAALPYEFNRFSFISRLVRKGSRLRLTVGPLHSINWQKNSNCGGVVALESSREARSVNVRLYHDAACPSTLFVPFAQPPSLESSDAD